MVKLILRCNYFKNESARHKANYVKYLGTREGVEFDPEQLPQAFYEDEDMHGKKENFVDYVAGRPGVVHVPGQRHGLFSNVGEQVDLDRVMKEVSEHKGRVWINVISLKREDAERLGYDRIEPWQMLLRGHATEFANAFKIPMGSYRWYAAFHDEGHHPHVHLLIYSEGRDGYLRKKAIEELKSVLVRDVFKDELKLLYDEKTKQRKNAKEKAGEELLAAMKGMTSSNADALLLEARMRALAKRLSGIKGKKVYGYLHKDVKAMVDEVFRELEKLPEVKACYDGWLEWQARIVGYYQDGRMRKIPMSQNPEFKSVRNLIIQETLRMGHGFEIRRRKKDNEETGEELEKNIVPKSKVSKKDEGLTADDLSRLLKGLQKTFRGKMEQSRAGRRMISEFKARRLEIEKKAGLGQRDAEVAEDITQTL